eukprot:scaffold12677_cov63-Cyclotella_meneghiniana.AAC.3
MLAHGNRMPLFSHLSHQSVARGCRRRCTIVGRCYVSRDDHVVYPSGEESTTSATDSLGMSTLLKCGAAVSSMTLIGCFYNADYVNTRLGGSRFYSGSSSARCESSSNPKPPKPDNTGDKSSDSFFDMAQQWASDNIPKYEGTVDKHSSNIPKSSNPEESSIFSSPEQLLKVIGAFGSQSSSNYSDIDPTLPIDDKESNFNVKDSLQKYIGKIQSLSNPTKDQDPKNDSATEPKDDASMSDFISFFFSSNKQSSSDMNELIEKAHNIVNPATSSVTSNGLLDQILYFKKNSDEVQRAFEASFDNVLAAYGISMSDLLSRIYIPTLHYYLELEDSMKTPSWKRRVHRFYSDVEMEKVEELNEALILSELSYADSVEEVREGLERHSSSDGDTEGISIAERFRRKSSKPQWELLFCDIESRPNEPSHFLAVQKNASKYDDTLHVLMVVRGTKSMSDLMTDALLEATDYECLDDNGQVLRGKAHSGMVKSGQYLVKRHQKLLSTLLGLSNKRKIEINLIGHSLGAGAATIAAMEWNSKGFQLYDNGDFKSSNKRNNIDISAHVIGFGCPAILSKSLSTMTQGYCTTVIADADLIPRMSGATLVNLALDLLTFDYRKEAERDVEQALKELQYRFSGGDLPLGKKSKMSFNIEDEAIKTVMGYVRQGLDKVIEPGVISSDSNGKNQTVLRDFKKMEPMLFPPGTCIHFYRDGSGISGTYTPCTFYNEIDVARTMVEDHLISSGYRRIFLSAMRDFRQDDHFSFESTASKK